MNTPELDFEKLMAYADGELDADSAKEVEQLMRQNAQAREAVDNFQRDRQALAGGLDGILNEPVPQRLIDAIRQHPGAAAAPSPGHPALPEAHPVVPSGGANSATGRVAANDRAYWPSLATAAAVALTVGLFAGQWWGSGAKDSTLATAHVLQEALQTTPSGQTLAARSVRITPLGSFQSDEGQVCREFEQTAEGRSAHGLACLESSRWVTRLMIDRGLSTVAGGAGDGTYVPASGETDALSAMFEQLKLGPAMSGEEERQILQRGWATKP